MDALNGEPEPTPNEPTPDPEPVADPPEEFGAGLEMGGDPPANTPEVSQGTGSPGNADPAPGEPTPEPVTGDPWLESLQQFGFQDVENEEQARERVLDALRLSREREQQFQQTFEQIKPMVGYGRQYIALQRDPRYQQFLEQQQQTQEPQEEETWWNPPEYNEALVAEYREQKIDPETGEVYVAWKADTPAQLRAQHEAYTQYLRNWQNQLIHNPREAIGNAIRHEARKLFQEEQSKLSQESRYTQALERFQQQHADILFERDPYTNRPTNRLSAHGQLIANYVDQLENSGMTDPDMIFEYAMLRYQTEVGGRQPQFNQPPQQQQPSQPVPAAPAAPQQPSQPRGTPSTSQRQMDFLRRGAGQATNGEPNLPGSAAPQPQPNRNLSAGQRLLEQLRHDQVLA